MRPFSILCLLPMFILYANGSCKTSYRTESYQSSYTTTCGSWWWASCTKYRISYKQVSYLYCDGGWSSWSAINSTTGCSTTCGVGIQYGQRTRTCTNPSPVNGGKPCLGSGILTVTRPCKIRDCPIDGGWSSWSAIRWITGCSTTCGVGIQYGQRTRTCTNPRPENGGKPCSGSSTLNVKRACKLRDCPPVDGGWSDYVSVSWNGDCSTTCKCDYGIESGYKNRTCTNPEPAYGGKYCVGDSFAINYRPCKLKECPDNTLTVKCDHNGQYIPHPTDCHKFYHCAWTTPVEKDCQNGLAWNEIIQNCDYMENVPLCNQVGSKEDSSQNTSKDTSGEFECGDQTGFLADPKNCTTFYRCAHGQIHHVSCATGTYFSGGECIEGECDKDPMLT